MSNIDDLKNYIYEEKQFYLKLLINILHNIHFGRYDRLHDIEKYLLNNKKFAVVVAKWSNK